MKKPFKLSKFLLIPLTVFFALTTNNLVFAIAYSKRAYIDFTIGEGLSTDGEGMNGVLISINDKQYPIGTSSSWNPKEICNMSGTSIMCNGPAFLYYVSAPGYQNAQCLVDGVPKAASEEFTFSTSSSSPTQIICTAEKIPDEPEEPDTPEGQNSSVDFNLNISEMLEIIGLPSTIALDIDSSNFGTLATTTLNLFTSSNYAYGYNFTLLTDSTNLTDSTTSAAIPTLASGTYTDANFTTNRWGFSLDSTNFRPIATTNTLYSTTTPSISTPTTITLGLKLDATQPAGTYSTILNFALTPNIVTE